MTPLWLGQSGLLAAGAIPVYCLARQQVSRELSGLLALLYLVQPCLLEQNRFGPQASALVIPLILFALWAQELGRWGYYALALALAMLGSGGSAAPSLVMLGLVLGPTRGRWWTLLTLLIVTLGWPTLRPMAFLNWQSVAPLAALLSCLAWLPLLSPVRLLPALPYLLGDELSWRPDFQGLEPHYGASLLPFLMWAAIGGAQRLARLTPGPVPAWLAALALTQSLLLGPLAPWNDTIKLRERGADYAPALEPITADSSVSTDNVLGLKLRARAQMYAFPNPFLETWGRGPWALAQAGPGGSLPLPAGALRRVVEAGQVDHVALDLEEVGVDGRYVLDSLLRWRMVAMTYCKGRFVALGDRGSGTSLWPQQLGPPPPDGPTSRWERPMVVQHCRDFLGHEPMGADLEPWLAPEVDRDRASRTFFHSPAFWGRGQRLCRKYWRERGRLPTFEEFHNASAAAPESPVDAEISRQIVVTLAYFGYLHRAPDPGGYQHYLQLMKAKADDELPLIRSLLDSTEYGRRLTR